MLRDFETKLTSYLCTSYDPEASLRSRVLTGDNMWPYFQPGPVRGAFKGYVTTHSSGAHLRSIFELVHTHDDAQQREGSS